MKIYGKTDDIIVREMTESDMPAFHHLVRQRNAKNDFTEDELALVFEKRKADGVIQACITSSDGSGIYGFCGIRAGERSDIDVSLFDETGKPEYVKQAKAIMREFLSEKQKSF